MKKLLLLGLTTIAAVAFALDENSSGGSGGFTPGQDISVDDITMTGNLVCNSPRDKVATCDTVDAGFQSLTAHWGIFGAATSGVGLGNVSGFAGLWMGTNAVQANAAGNNYTLFSQTGNDLLIGVGTGDWEFRATNARKMILSNNGEWKPHAKYRRMGSYQVVETTTADFDTAGLTRVHLPAPVYVLGGGTCTKAAVTTNDDYVFVSFGPDNVANRACGIGGPFTTTRSTHLPTVAMTIRTDPTIVTNIRYFYGFSDAALDQEASLAGLNGNRGCFFRFDTGLSDTNWMACSSDGTTASCTATTIAVAAATNYNMLIENSTSGTCWFYVDNNSSANVVAKSTNINTSNTNLGLNATTTVLSGVFRFGNLTKLALWQR